MKKILLLLHLLTAAFFASAQNVGIGTTAPLTKLHVANGASGATPFVFSPLVVESNGHTYINLLSPAANETAILFGQPGSAANGVIMYNTSGTTNGFQFRNNGNQTRMVIDNAGNVGIGTTTPAFPLSFGTALGDKISLWSNSSNSYGFGIQGGLLQIHTDISTADIAFGYGSSAAFIERMRIKGDGNVGIGTSTPAQKLHVEGTTFLNGNVGIGTITPYARLTFTDNSSGEIISFRGNASNNFGIGIAIGLLQIHTDNSIADIAFGYGSSGEFTERMRIKGDGNVGIGTTTPVQKLHVEGTTYLNGNVGIGESAPAFPLSFNTDIGDKISLWSNSANSYGFGIQGGLLQIHTNISSADIAFGSGSSAAFNESMRIKGNGLVGIGTNTPDFPLSFPNSTGDKISFYGNAGNHFGIGIQGFVLQIHSPSSTDDIAFGWGRSAAFFELMRIKGNGNVGIGTADPQQKLHVVGNSIFTGLVGIGTATPSQMLEVNGNIKCVNLIQTSDSRLKKDIVPIHNSLQKIIQLNGYNYYWKNENAGNSLQTGILAQEVQKLFPTLVKEGKDGMLSVNYIGLIPVMIESIKEQQNMIEKQQQQIDSFAKHDKEQQQQIDELKKLVETLLKQ